MCLNELKEDLNNLIKKTRNINSCIGLFEEKLKDENILVEKSIIESEKVFRELFDNMSSGVAVYESIKDGKDFLIKDFNKAGEEISKLNHKEIIGKKIGEVFPGIKELGLFDVIQRVWNTEKSEHHPISQYKDERVTSWVENYVYKLPSGLIVVIFDDVSEQRESEDKLKQLNKELEKRVLERATELNDSENKYRVLFEQAGDMIIVLDTENGEIIDFNDKMHETLGYTREEFNKIRVPDFDMMEEDEDYKAHIELIIKKGSDLFESKYRTKLGEIKDILINAKAIKIKEKTYLHSIMRDITGLKELDERLKESEEKYRKTYYQANLYRDIFAHDINNILQNINSSAELSSLYLNNPEKLHTISELYEIIHEQVARGIKLIKNVRKINEIDDSEIELEKIDTLKSLDNAIEFLKSSFQARNLDVKIKTQEKKVFVIANNLLLDVFENILINAVRHNNSTSIEIIIEIKKENLDSKNYLRMEFNDNGLGISDYRKKSIFEKGARKSQRSKGMGLGLSLVKKIIDSYQGEIWVEDRIKGDYKQGCKFVILLEEAL